MMERTIIELKDAPEVLRKAVEKKMTRNERPALLLKVFHTSHRYVAYMTVDNLCLVLSVWNFDADNVQEDSVTVGDIEVFRNHPEMKMWFS